MHIILLIVGSCLATVYAEQRYIIGIQGHSCLQACAGIAKYCNPYIKTGDNTNLFIQLGIRCTTEPYGVSSRLSNWIVPSYVSATNDVDYGKCAGYRNVPEAKNCLTANGNMRRLCLCDDDPLPTVPIEQLKAIVEKETRPYTTQLNTNQLKLTLDEESWERNYNIFSTDCEKDIEKYRVLSESKVKRINELNEVISSYEDQIESLTAILEDLRRR